MVWMSTELHSAVDTLLAVDAMNLALEHRVRRAPATRSG
jgi:hypothetical protein